MIARTVIGLFVIPVYSFTAACFTDQTAWIAATIYIAVDFFIIAEGAEEAECDYRQQRQEIL